MPTVRQVALYPIYLRVAFHILAVVTILCLAPMGNLRAQAVPQPGSSQAVAPSESVPPEEVVITVGDQKITAKEFDTLINNLPPEVANALPGMGKRGFAERYANMMGLAKEGEKLKVNESERFLQMAAFQRLMLLAQFTIGHVTNAQGTANPEEISSYYNAHQSEFQQVKLRGIYIPFTPEGESREQASAQTATGAPAKPKLSEAEAQAKAADIEKRINAGEDMAALAKKESDHATAAKGGDLGLVRHGQFAPQIDNVIFSLETNKASAPVRDRFGYFVFRVEGKQAQPLEEVRGQIEPLLRQQKLGGIFTKVQADYPVNLNPRYFGDQAPAAPPTAVPPK